AQTMRKCKKGTKHLRTVGACLGVVVGGPAILQPGAAQGSEVNTNKLEKLEKENQDLQQRLETLEALAKKEGLMPSGAKLDPPVSAMSEISISGFVTASYFHDSSE